MISLHRFRFVPHLTNKEFFKEWTRWYKDSMENFISTSFETEFMIKAKTQYPYLPNWLAYRVHAIRLGYLVVGLNFEAFENGNQRRLMLQREISKWVFEKIHPQGNTYLNVYMCLWHRDEAKGLDLGCSPDEYSSKHYHLISGTRADVDPFTSVLQGLIVVGDIDWRKYDYWIGKAKELDNAYLAGELTNMMGDRLEIATPHEEDAESILLLQSRFNEINEKRVNAVG